MVVGWLTTSTLVQVVDTARDAPAIPCCVRGPIVVNMCLAHGCRSVPLGTLCDTMRWVCGAVVQGWAPAVGTLRRYHPSGRNGAAAQMGRYGDTMDCGMAYDLHILGSRRSGRFGDTFRLGRCVPGGWVGLHQFAGCIRCSAVNVRTTVGLNRLGEVRVQTWMFGVVSRAHKRSRVICFFDQVITLRAAPHQCREKTTEWFSCMGGAARCLMSDVYWGSAVGKVAGPPAQGGKQILGGVPLFQEQSVNVVLIVAVCWVDRWDWVFARCWVD